MRRNLSVTTAVRLAFGVASASLLLAVVAAIVAHWLDAVVAMAVAALAIVLVAGLRSARERLAAGERRALANRQSTDARLEELEQRIRGAESAAEVLLGYVRGTARADGAVGVSRDVGVEMAKLLAERGGALAADSLVRQADAYDLLPLRTIRAIGRVLRRRGYLENALPYFEAAARLGTANDKAGLQLRAAENAVLRGEANPAVVSGPVSPRDGVVMHVVGKTIASTQSGYTLRTHYTARAQLKRGLEPVVVAQVAANGDVPVETVVDGVAYKHPQGPSPQEVGQDVWLQANAEALLAQVLEVRPAVLHAHADFLNGLTAAAVGRATGIPVVYESRGFWEESWLSRIKDAEGATIVDTDIVRFGTPDAYAWRRQREHDARALADRVVTLAEVMVGRIADDGIARDLVDVVPNAVDTESFPVATRDAELAADLGVRSDEIVIGYVSSIVEYEGIDVLVRGFARARELTSRPLKLLVVGTGPVLDGLRALAAVLGLEDALFTGRVPHDQVLRYYSLIDVFVVPRKATEVCHLVTPLKPFEAFSTGRTLVMSDVRALQEIADDSGAALTFRAEDVEDLAKTIVQIANDDDERARLARAGAAWVREARTWDANAEAYASVYRKVGASGY